VYDTYTPTGIIRITKESERISFSFMKRGTLKVMVGRDGTARVQEETDESVKIYSADEWKNEMSNRREEAEKAKHEKPVKQKKAKVAKTEDVSEAKVEKKTEAKPSK
jgi:hypothetical protein